MIGDFVLARGELAGPEAAVFSLDDTEITYGYGCYETLKVREGLLYFASLHAERLLASARVLGIGRLPEAAAVTAGLERLVAANAIPDCNVKLLLYGREGGAADWFAFLLPPLRPPAGSRERGVDCLAYRGERHFPNAKSLSMLLSTVAFREAARLGAWDALLVNRRGELTEGTRTNLFYLDPTRDGVLYTPPAVDCLSGITRHTLAEALAERGVRVEERRLTLGEASSAALSLFVSSTSSLLLPVRRILDGDTAVDLPLDARGADYEAMYDAYLAAYVRRLRSGAD
ncbi:MAG: aminotransferase class IV [Spirochaetaceae bacterium]|nr:aminotransferase class IV [Spirochaetaceae bacterium]